MAEGGAGGGLGSWRGNRDIPLFLYWFTLSCIHPALSDSCSVPGDVNPKGPPPPSWNLVSPGTTNHYLKRLQLAFLTKQ